MVNVIIVKTDIVIDIIIEIVIVIVIDIVIVIENICAINNIFHSYYH